MTNVPHALTVRGTQALVSFAPLAFKALLVDFLLRDARLSVLRGGRVVVVHDGDEHLV